MAAADKPRQQGNVTTAVCTRANLDVHAAAEHREAAPEVKDAQVAATAHELGTHDDDSDTPAMDELEASAIGRAMLATSTSNSWSMLDAVAAKVSRRLRERVSARELDELMARAGDAALQKHGVWRTSFGAKYMPIVLINPAFARTVAAGGAASTSCSCKKRAGAPPGEPSGAQRYFRSHDYNAGRHAAERSSHKASCVMWRPPDAGHLHSWRRGFPQAPLGELKHG